MQLIRPTDWLHRQWEMPLSGALPAGGRQQKIAWTATGLGACQQTDGDSGSDYSLTRILHPLIVDSGGARSLVRVYIEFMTTECSRTKDHDDDTA